MKGVSHSKHRLRMGELDNKTETHSQDNYFKNAVWIQGAMFWNSDGDLCKAFWVDWCVRCMNADWRWLPSNFLRVLLVKRGFCTEIFFSLQASSLRAKAPNPAFPLKQDLPRIKPFVSQPTTGEMVALLPAYEFPSKLGMLETQFRSNKESNVGHTHLVLAGQDDWFAPVLWFYLKIEKMDIKVNMSGSET